MADNRLAYGIAKGLGIDTTEMSPKEVWEAIAKKKGVSVEQAQKQAYSTESKDSRKSTVEKLQELTKARASKDNVKDDGIEVVEVDLTIDIQKQFDNATPKERSKIAYNYIMDNLRGEYETIDGRKVPIEKIGADKITHNYYEPKIRSSTELGLLLQSGRFIEEKPAKKENGDSHKQFSSFAYYKVIIAIGKNKYSAVLNVGIRPDKKCTLYDINQFIEI